MHISPEVIQASIASTLSVQGLGVVNGAWLVFLPAGDASCIGALMPLLGLILRLYSA